jgi:hypothetical protein
VLQIVNHASDSIGVYHNICINKYQYLALCKLRAHIATSGGTALRSGRNHPHASTLRDNSRVIAAAIIYNNHF